MSRTSTPCPVPGCPNQSRYRTGLCNAHAERLRRTGDVQAHKPVLKIGRPDVGYRTAHRRIEMAKGKARQHTCPCGQPAREWAYIESDDPRHDRTDLVDVGHGKRLTLRYSTDPGAYLPLCLSCHRGLDAERACL